MFGVTIQRQEERSDSALFLFKILLEKHLEKEPYSLAYLRCFSYFCIHERSSYGHIKSAAKNGRGNAVDA